MPLKMEIVLHNLLREILERSAHVPKTRQPKLQSFVQFVKENGNASKIICIDKRKLTYAIRKDLCTYNI